MNGNTGKRKQRAYGGKQKSGWILPAFLGTAAVVLITLVVLLFLQPDSAPDRQSAMLTVTEAPELQAAPEPINAEETPSESTEDSILATAAPAPHVTVVPPEINAIFRPEAREGWLPVFKSSLTNEKIIAITVDDCFQAENLRTIVDTAVESGAKLTIFPIGQNVLRESVAESLRYAWEQGFELENHTFTHNGLFACSNTDLAREIYYQNLALSKILNTEYHCHFLRPKGGDAKDDQRIHAYAKQMGYYGIAHWNVVGSGSGRGSLMDALKPGAIYLFHTTNSDTEMLQGFIPYAVSMGFRLVTLNEMFGYEANETAELTLPIEEHQMPELEPYTVIPVAYKKPAYAYGVYLIQEKLNALGLLKDTPDGVYGPQTVKAIRQFQTKVGLPVTGEADLETQERLASY